MIRYLACLLFCSNVFAQSPTTYISPSGSDSNNCLTTLTKCATLAKGVSAVAQILKPGDMGVVLPDAGTYDNTNLVAAHGVRVTIQGNCSNQSSTEFRTAGGGTVFSVQDNATLILSCIKCSSTGDGATCAHARQFAILDWAEVVFGSFPLGKHVDLQEMSKGNCAGNVYMIGGAATHVSVQGMSSVILGCNVVFIDAPTIQYFLSVAENSYALAAGTSFTGSVNVTSNSYVVDGARLKKGSVTIPGPSGINSNGWVQ